MLYGEKVENFINLLLELYYDIEMEVQEICLPLEMKTALLDIYGNIDDVTKMINKNDTGIIKLFTSESKHLSVIVKGKKVMYNFNNKNEKDEVSQ